MKKKILLVTTVGVLSILLSYQMVSIIAGSTSKGDLHLAISAPKSTFKLGETVTFDINLSNTGEKNVSIMDTFNEGSGYLNILISQDGKNFKKYVHSTWGQDDTFRGNLELSPDDSKLHSLTVLWNKKPNNSPSIAEDVKKRAANGKILTDYAFPEAGKYFVKVTYAVQRADQKQSTSIESQPFTITIEAPEGDDLSVWKMIRNNGEFAYLIQEGDIPITLRDTEDGAKFISQVESIVTEHPSSFYATILGQSLDKFRASEAKRQELNQKLQKQNPH